MVWFGQSFTAAPTIALYRQPARSRNARLAGTALALALAQCARGKKEGGRKVPGRWEEGGYFSSE